MHIVWYVFGTSKSFGKSLKYELKPGFIFIQFYSIKAIHHSWARDTVQPPCHALSSAPQRFTLAHQAPRESLLLAGGCGGSLRDGGGWQMVQWYVWRTDGWMALTLLFFCCMYDHHLYSPFMTFTWIALLVWRYVYRVTVEKTSIFWFYALVYSVVANHSLLLQYFLSFGFFPVSPYGSDTGRKFAWRQHEHTQRKMNVTQT